MPPATFYKSNKKAQTRPAPTPGLSQTSITIITFLLVGIAIYFIIRSQPGLASESQGLISQIGAGLKKSGIDFSGTFGFLKKIITDPKGFAEEEIFSDQAQKELEQVKNPGVEIQKVSPITDPTFLFPPADPTTPDEGETELAIQGFIKAVSIERKFPICVKLWASADANGNLYMDCTKGGTSGSDAPSVCPQIPEVDPKNIFILNGPRFPNSPFVCTTSSKEILQALPNLPTDANFPLQTLVNLAYSYKSHAQKQVFIADKNTYFQILGRGEDPAIRFNIDSTKIKSYTSKGPVNVGIGIGAGGDLTDLILSDTLNFLTLQINNQGDGTIKPKDIFVILPSDVQIPQSSFYEYDPSPTDTPIKQDYCKKMRPNDAKCDQRLTNMGVLRLSAENLKKSKLVDEDGFIKDTKTIPLAVTIPTSFLSGLEITSMIIIVEINYEYHQEQKLSFNVRKIPTQEEEQEILAATQTGTATPTGPATTPITGEMSVVLEPNQPIMNEDYINEILRSPVEINGQQMTSPVVGSGENIGSLLREFADKYKIDPAFALAFFWMESRFGTDPAWDGLPGKTAPLQRGCEEGTKNPGNIMHAEECGLCNYEYKCGSLGGYHSWRNGFEAWFNLIAKSNTYVKGGRKTVEQIVKSYSDNNREYINVVRQKVTQWRSNTDRLSPLPPQAAQPSLPTTSILGYQYPLSLSPTCVTSDFGLRTLGGAPDYHYGLDLECREGDPVKSISNGKVVAVIDQTGRGQYSPENIETRIPIENNPSALGNRVHICDFSNGYCMIYAHLNSISVIAGSAIRAGDNIGTCGKTGTITGDHLHLQVHNIGLGKDETNVEYKYREPGPPINPAQFLDGLTCCPGFGGDNCEANNIQIA